MIDELYNIGKARFKAWGCDVHLELTEHGADITVVYCTSQRVAEERAAELNQALKSYTTH